MTAELSGRIQKIVGLYPERLVQRRNTDHLYYHALRDLYDRLGLPFEVIPDCFYNVAATLLYQTATRSAHLGARLVMKKCMERLRRLAIPQRLVGGSTLYHGAFFGLPANVSGGLVHETEFYDFSRADDEEPIARNFDELNDLDMSRMRAVLMRTELSRSFFCRKYAPKWHALAYVVPFHMPYLARWELREPVKPDPAVDGLGFIFVGNQARRKGLDHFVRFAAEVRRVSTGPTPRFTVVSNFQDGSDFDLSGFEVYRGLNGAQVQDLMEKSHYLVLPTRSDSHPKVCYEAAATGCGLILSDIRPLRDIWSDGGHIFSLVNGSDAIKGMAISVVAEADPLSHGRRNRARFLKEFSPSASTAAHKIALGL